MGRGEEIMIMLLIHLRLAAKLHLLRGKETSKCPGDAVLVFIYRLRLFFFYDAVIFSRSRSRFNAAPKGGGEGRGPGNLTAGTQEALRVVLCSRPKELM